MRTEVAASMRQADLVMPEIKRILGEYLIAAPAADEDALRNTDLIVLTVGGLGGIRIACRVRELCHLERYGHQFTIRYGRPNGTETELTKLLRGFGDYLFYGFADAQHIGLVQWFIGDLSEFRVWFNRETVRRRGEIPGEQGRNLDGSSTFLAFNVRDLPSQFVVAASWL